MNKKTFKKLIQHPLRFHHQDIHEELQEIKLELSQIKNILTNLEREHIEYEHPWYAYKRNELIASGNYEE